MKFNVSYRAKTNVKVSGTIEAESEEKAREQVASGAPLEDESIEPDGDFGPSSMESIDLEEVKECPEDFDDEDDDDFEDDDFDDDDEDDFEDDLDEEDDDDFDDFEDDEDDDEWGDREDD